MKKIILICVLTLGSLITFSQDDKSGADKTVSVTVSGQGKTQDEAKQNALRNAIEQAFGAFISSKTEILNDALVKDEIVSVSNGNIQEFKILSEVQTPDGLWSNTVLAKVSVSKLTSFCESKGITVEFKGGLFAINVKQQALNEQNEITTVSNMCSVLKEISNKSFDFEIQAKEPIAKEKDIFSGNKPDKWLVPITINVKPNNNFINISQYLLNTLKGITLTGTEAADYIKLKKKIYPIVFSPIKTQDLTSNETNKEKKKNKEKNVAGCNAQVFYLRTMQSVDNIIAFVDNFKKSLLGFEINNGVTSLQGIKLYKEAFKLQVFAIEGKQIVGFKQVEIKDVGFNPIFYQEEANGSTDFAKSLFNINVNSAGYNHYYFNLSLSKIDADQPNDYEGKPKDYGINKYFPDVHCIQKTVDIDKYYVVISFKDIFINKRIVYFEFNDELTTAEISNVKEYKVVPFLK